MVLLKELRIPLPLTVEEYQVGQLYTLIEASREGTAGDAGVEIIANEPFDNERGKGQYTHKIFHLGSKVPRIVAAFLPASALTLVEKAWNAYPYCRTEYSNPWLGERFSIVIETRHVADSGTSENVHNLTKEELEMRQVMLIDIGSDVVPNTSPDMEPSRFQSKLTNRGPLLPGWSAAHSPIMCCYKLVTIKFQVFGLQTKVEDIVQKSQVEMLCKFHKEVFCMIDRWHGLTMQDIRSLEDQIKQELNQKLEQMSLPTRETDKSTTSSTCTPKSTPN